LGLGIMVSIAVGVTALFAALTVLNLWKSSGKPAQDVILGAILQAALFGLIFGFLFIPNAPPPPPMGRGILWFTAAIVLVEVVRTGLYLHIPFLPKAILRYRLAALRIKRDNVERSLKSMERLVAGRAAAQPAEETLA